MTSHYNNSYVNNEMCSQLNINNASMTCIQIQTVFNVFIICFLADEKIERKMPLIEECVLYVINCTPQNHIPSTEEPLINI